MRSRLSEHLRPLAASIILLGTTGALIGTTGAPLAASVACGCEGGGPGTLVPEPTTLDFGEVTIGNSETLTDRLTARIAEVNIKETEDRNNPPYHVTSDGCKAKNLKPNEACEIAVTFTPKYQGETVGAEWVMPLSGPVLVNLELTGKGRNKITLTPEELKWAPKEETVKEITISTLTEIEIKDMKTNDPTDFALPEKAGCKLNKKITSTTPCKVEVKRLTETKTGQKKLELKYKEEDGHEVVGKEGVLVGE